MHISGTVLCRQLASHGHSCLLQPFTDLHNLMSVLDHKYCWSTCRARHAGGHTADHLPPNPHVPVTHGGPAGCCTCALLHTCTCDEAQSSRAHQPPTCLPWPTLCHAFQQRRQQQPSRYNLSRHCSDTSCRSTGWGLLPCHERTKLRCGTIHACSQGTTHVCSQGHTAHTGAPQHPCFTPEPTPPGGWHPPTPHHTPSSFPWPDTEQPDTEQPDTTQPDTTQAWRISQRVRTAEHPYQADLQQWCLPRASHLQRPSSSAHPHFLAWPLPLLRLSSSLAASAMSRTVGAGLAAMMCAGSSSTTLGMKRAVVLRT
jgi:hypothetical protein